MFPPSGRRPVENSCYDTNAPFIAHPSHERSPEMNRRTVARPRTTFRQVVDNSSSQRRRGPVGQSLFAGRDFGLLHTGMRGMDSVDRDPVESLARREPPPPFGENPTPRDADESGVDGRLPVRTFRRPALPDPATHVKEPESNARVPVASVHTALLPSPVTTPTSSRRRPASHASPVPTPSPGRRTAGPQPSPIPAHVTEEVVTPPAEPPSTLVHPFTVPVPPRAPHTDDDGDYIRSRNVARDMDDCYLSTAPPPPCSSTTRISDETSLTAITQPFNISLHSLDHPSDREYANTSPAGSHLLLPQPPPVPPRHTPSITSSRARSLPPVPQDYQPTPNVSNSYNSLYLKIRRCSCSSHTARWLPAVICLLVLVVVLVTTLVKGKFCNLYT